MARKKNKNQLLKQLRKQSRQVNKKLQKLRRGYDLNKAVKNPKTGKYERPKKEVERVSYKTGTWASKRLKNKLDTSKLRNVFKGGRITLTESLNITDLTAVKKAMDQFLSSETSTIKGIENVKEKTKKSLKATIEIDDEDFTDDELEFIYEMMGDEDITSLKENNYFASKSDISEIIIDARDMKDTEEEFISRLESYANSNDKYIQEKAISLYNKHIKNYIKE